MYVLRVRGLHLHVYIVLHSFLWLYLEIYFRKGMYVWGPLGMFLPQGTAEEGGFEYLVSLSPRGERFFAWT